MKETCYVTRSASVRLIQAIAKRADENANDTVFGVPPAPGHIFGMGIDESKPRDRARARRCHGNVDNFHAVTEQDEKWRGGEKVAHDEANERESLSKPRPPGHASRGGL